MPERVQRGVAKVERLRAQWTKTTLIWVYAGLMVLASVTSLESQVTYIFVPYITSDFSAHGLLSTVQIISAVLQTVLKAPAAKVADVFGRTEAMVLGVLFYILGYVCMACSSNIWSYAASQILYIGGNTGVEFLLELIVADTSSLINRALLSGLTNAPFLWTVWAGPPLGQYLLDTVDWRWGVGLWAFVIPVAATPILSLFIVHQRRLRKEDKVLLKEADEPLRENTGTTTYSHVSLVDKEDPPTRTLWRSLLHYMNELDVVGTLIISAALALTLVPLTLASSSSDSWRDGGIIASICCGVVAIGVFVLYELRLAPRPLISLRLFKSPSILASCGAGFFYFFAFYVGRLYFPSYLQVAAFQSPSNAGLINNGVNFASTAFSIISGVCIKYTRTISPYLYSGSIIYIVGLIMITFWRNPQNNIAGMVSAQVILGIGGGLFATPNQTIVQAHVIHQDLSAATALVLIITTLGWSTGAAVAGAIWTNALPSKLAQTLPSEFHDLIPDISHDITVAMSYPAGSQIRDAINEAYFQVMRILCWTALGLGVCMLLCVCFIRQPPNTFRKEDAEAPVSVSETLPVSAPSETHSVSERLV